ncbi:UNVERIFIED_CONTAM: F-box/kelch-repeat protein SKIP4 [Sesamum angustifolium]|uniref:F-box/kelch-repeat protein SKIP4 n=1 Tax=Sesamum angustifolium TaxID=2727405 RepID=A0AAW2RHR3_9LAMI
MESTESGSWTLNPQELPPVRDGTKIGIEGLIESEKPTLIPGLPDDIAFSCLARVPRKYHPVLNCVSKRWRELICGEEWYSYRLKHHLEETWATIAIVDFTSYFHGIVSNDKRFMLIRDSMPFIIRYIEDSVVLEGNYIRCGISAVSSYVYAVVYEPSSGTWQHADTDMACGWRGPAVVIDGVLYVLDQTSGVRLMMWQNEAREWMAIRRLSTHLIIPPCRLVAIGKKIFVVGKGLSTVMFDVESAGCVDGVFSKFFSEIDF